MMRAIQLAVACVAVLVATTGQVQAGMLYVESSSTMYVVDTSTGTLSNSFGIMNSGPMAVADTIRMRDDSGNTVTEYSLSGGFLGQSSVSPSFSFFGRDGTTDGVDFNYAMPNSNGTTTVYRYDRDWSNETALFSFSNSPNVWGMGITYDLSNDSLWVANDVPGNDIKNFDLAGNLLSSFSFAGGLGRPGPLAYDGETDTLWFMTESGNNFLQFDKSGNLLDSFTVAGISGQGYNMEFAVSEVSAVPEPSSLALFGIGACVAGLGAARRRRREKQQEATA